MGIFFPLLFIVGIGLAVVGLGIVLYLRAVASRKVYNCPQCGEVVRCLLNHHRQGFNTGNWNIAIDLYSQLSQRLTVKIGFTRCLEDYGKQSIGVI